MACVDKCWYRAAQVYQDIPNVQKVVPPEGLGNMLWFIVMNALSTCAFMGLCTEGW